MSTAAFHHQVSFRHRWFLVNPHPFQLISTNWISAFSRSLLSHRCYSIASNRLCNDSLLILWLSLWSSELPGLQTETTDQQVVLRGDLLVRYNLDITHMLAEGFSKQHIIDLRKRSDKVIRLLFKTDVADGQVAEHGKLQQSLALGISCAPAIYVKHPLIQHLSIAYMIIPVWLCVFFSQCA